MSEYIMQCWNCLGEYDALSAVWCSCSPTSPTKVCPFCLGCFCGASDSYRERFWANAPDQLKDEKNLLGQARGPLGEALIGAKVITNEQLLEALRVQRSTGQRLGECLVSLGAITRETLTYFLQRQKSVTRLNLTDKPPNLALLKKLDVRDCVHRRIIPVEEEIIGQKAHVILGMVNPSDGDTIEHVQSVTGWQVVPVQVDEMELQAYLAPFLEKAEAEQAAQDASTESDDLLLKLLASAVRSGASDLHLEPKETEVSVHYRIDGVLYKVKPLPSASAAPVASSVKRLLHLPADVVGRAQAGRASIRHEGRLIQLNGTLLPTIHGEAASVKIIDQEGFLKPLDQLGMDKYAEGLLRRMMELPQGLVVLAGPIFNGTTTTAYSLLREISQRGERKVMTLESPITAQLDGVIQTEVADLADHDDFSTALKGMANANAQVAAVTVQKTPFHIDQVVRLSGLMMVVTSLESNRAPACLRALMDLASDRALLAQNLRLIVVQRLLRRVCPACAEPITTSDRFLSMFGLRPEEMENMQVLQGKGCSECRKIGYRGRVAVFEALPVTAALRAMIEAGASLAELENSAGEEGMIPMRARVLKLVRDGKTTLDEFQKANL